MSASDIPPPDWFAGKTYKYPSSDDPKAWLRELERINGLFWEGREEWRGIVSDIDNWHPSYFGPPPVEAIDREEVSRELLALEQPALLVRVHLKAPDGTILEGFRSVLAEARKTHPSPVRNRGRDSIKGRFSRSKLSTWRRYRIIELAELLAWRKKEWPENGSAETGAPPRRPSDAQLGRWLNFNAAEVRVAMQTLESALDAIPAIWAQVNERSK